MKTKKSSLLVILSLVMVLALACSAWALRTTTLIANGAGVTVSATEDIATTAQDQYGVHAVNGGYVSVLGYDVSTAGNGARAVAANMNGEVLMRGDITTSGQSGYGVNARVYSSVDLTGDITTTGGIGIGIQVYDHSYVSMDGNIDTSGFDANGVAGYATSNISVTGNIKTTGDNSTGAYAEEESSIAIKGNVATTGDRAIALNAYNEASITVVGKAATSGLRSNVVNAVLSSIISVAGDIEVSGAESYALLGTLDSTVNMMNGTLSVTDDSSIALKLEDDSTSNLSNVDVEADVFLITSTSGVLNVKDSGLSGDIIHGGMGATAETLEVNLEDTTLEGAILASEGFGSLTGGVVDVVLKNSDWIVADSSNTNGKVTGDINSAIDFTEAPGETTVTIDELVGNPTITLKPGDQLNITNSTGNNGDFSSSNPDVLEVVTNPDGSVEIISKGEGDADLTYSYTDELGGKHTVTVDASPADPNGTGSTPDTGRSGGGSSSGCNAGFGALFALLGLAVVAKKK